MIRRYGMHGFAGAGREFPPIFQWGAATGLLGVTVGNILVDSLPLDSFAMRNSVFLCQLPMQPFASSGYFVLAGCD